MSKLSAPKGDQVQTMKTAGKLAAVFVFIILPGTALILAVAALMQIVKTKDR